MHFFSSLSYFASSLYLRIYGDLACEINCTKQRCYALCPSSLRKKGVLVSDMAFTNLSNINNRRYGIYTLLAVEIGYRE